MASAARETTDAGSTPFSCLAQPGAVSARAIVCTSVAELLPLALRGIADFEVVVVICTHDTKACLNVIRPCDDED